MKPNQKPTSTYEKYVLEKKIEILEKVFYMITRTEWTYQHGDILDDLLDKFIELTKGLEENKRINLKDLVNKELIHKSNRSKLRK